MTTNSELDNFDLSGFKQHKERVQQLAAKAVAEKIAQIQKLLNDLREIGEQTGIEVDMHGLKEVYYGIDEVGYSLDSDWYSSSYSC